MACNAKTSDQHVSYSRKDRAQLMTHVQKHFGDITDIGQVRLPTGRDLEILAVVPPSRKYLAGLFAPAGSPAPEDEMLLLTAGAGAYSMAVPKDSELPPRAEYLIHLPADWDIQSDEGDWPVQLLLNIATVPETEQSYNAWGHTFGFRQGAPFAHNTQLCAAVLTGMNDREGQCRLSDGEVVTFYEVIPLYAEELDFTTEHGAVALIDEFMRYRIPRTVMPQRANVALLAECRRRMHQTMAPMKDDDIRSLMQQKHLSQEERLVIEDYLRIRTGVKKKGLDLMNGLKRAIFRR